MEKETYDVFGCSWEKIFQFKWSVGLEPRNDWKKNLAHTKVAHLKLMAISYIPLHFQCLAWFPRERKSIIKVCLMSKAGEIF